MPTAPQASPPSPHSRRKPARRPLRWAFSLAALGALAYLLLLTCPEPLFAHSRAGGSLVLRSNQPLPAEADSVILRAELKLARSPLFDPSRRYRVFLCTNDWRWTLLTLGDSRSAATARAPFFDNVVVRGAQVDQNRYLQATGSEAPGERTLDYLIAHEVTHLMVADFLGPLASWQLPAWVREGYADYVGRGWSFDYDAARRQVLGRAAPGTLQQSGRYLRYTLLVAQLLEHEGWTPARLLRSPPSPNAVLERIR